MRTVLLPQSESFSCFNSKVKESILKYNFQRICEIGSGPNPILSGEFVKERGITYHLYDKEQEELDKQKGGFKTKSVDFCVENVQLRTKYDLIISKMVLEHVEKPNVFHENVWNNLKVGGMAIHFFTTLYSVPTLTNLILPEKIAFAILKKLQKRNFETEGKFPAHYRKCFGPTRKAIKYFHDQNFNTLEYLGFLGHHYFWRNKVLYFIEKACNQFLLKLNSPKFTTSAIIILKK